MGEARPIDAAPSPHEQRILVLAPTGKDALLTCSALASAGIEALPCARIQDLVARLGEGAGAVVVSEEALADTDARPLSGALRDEPPWSDVPILLLTAHGADSSLVAFALQALGNVVLLERPLRPAALVSAARAALRARSRQYQLRAYLEDRERAEEALQEASRRKDEFLALLAHELRNPLAPIRSSLEVLRVMTARDTATDQVRQRMERQVDHLVRLVDDLLDVSRIRSGKMDLREAPTDLREVIRHAVEANEPSMRELGHRLELGLPAEPLVVRGDPVRLSQVFGNLLHNAAKFTPRAGRIVLAARRDGGDVVVSLRDSGAGIAPESLPHVFEMFVQDHRALGRSHGGLGIGLALVRSLVEMHGGRVTARSEGEGRGSEFTVTLPAAPAPSGVPASDEAAPASLAHHDILVVDDNRDAAESLAALLRLLGAGVRVAHGGAAALETMSRRPPSVAIVDLGMPGMDGYELAARVRSLPQLARTKLIALTGWGQDDDRRRSREAGFDHHVVKPASLSVLQGLIEAP